VDIISLQERRATFKPASGQKSISAQISLDCLQAEGIEITEPVAPEFSSILTVDAVRFVAKLVRQFSTRRLALLQRRVTIQARLNSGTLPSFLPETEEIRKASWKISPIPSDLQDRRVEITGPASDTKMVINALNSGASVFMADFEDAQSPTWNNILRGQINLRDAVNGTIEYVSNEGKIYHLHTVTSTLVVRPRGWHLQEKHFLVDGQPISASLFDFGLYFYHNVTPLLNKGTGPYFYLPKLENHLEARLWNDVFLFSQQELRISPGTIKATVLIETILAAFEMDEILYELQQHSAGLNCGRWDYIFSIIKKFHKQSAFVQPERSSITMDKSFLAAYVKLLIKTCHRRGAQAIGGMSAFIPIKNDDLANRTALDKVRADKEREASEGHDGTWVAHPGLVSVAKEVFDKRMSGMNQFHVLRQDDKITPADLLAITKGEITENGLRLNINIALQYIGSWLRGNGAVPLYNLMEDTATAEISRAQVWQWIHHKATMADGRTVTLELVLQLVREEIVNIRSSVGDQRYHAGNFEVAKTIFEELITDENFIDFLTVPAYEYL
jgi:malate synthase